MSFVAHIIILTYDVKEYIINVCVYAKRYVMRMSVCAQWCAIAHTHVIYMLCEYQCT